MFSSGLRLSSPEFCEVLFFILLFVSSTKFPILILSALSLNLPGKTLISGVLFPFETAVSSLFGKLPPEFPPFPEPDEPPAFPEFPPFPEPPAEPAFFAVFDKLFEALPVIIPLPAS